MNTNNFDLLYRERKTAPGVTGSPVIIDLERVNAARIRVLTHISVENKTSGYTKCRLSIFNGATDFFLDEAIYPSEDELLVHSKDVLLGEGDILRVTLTGTTTADDLEICATGWEMQRE
jgi:hypothetical protein